MADFYTLLTNAGIAYENACKAAGVPIKLTQMSVGDGNGAVYNPAATDTALRREVWRGPLNALFQDQSNPSWLLAEVTIPPEAGGFYVREAGLWTDTGILYAIVKYPESFKPVLASSGSGKEFYIRSIFETSNASQVTLLIDDTVVKATRAWVMSYLVDELAKLDGKQSVRVATTGNIVLSGAQQIDGVAVVSGQRVLVVAQTAAKDNGIYVVANGAWVRSADSNSSAKVTPGLTVIVEEGAANGDSLWHLVTNGPITLDTTALTFEMLAGRTGVSAGTYRSLTVDKYGRVTGGTSPTTLAGYGIDPATKVEAEAGDNTKPLTAQGALWVLGKVKGFAKFTANGSFTVPAGVTQIWLSGCGGGGGGGSGSGGTNSSRGSGGGSGGAAQSLIKEPYAVTPGQVIPITIGAGGAGGVGVGTQNAVGNLGTNGGNTVVGSLVTLTAGGGGSYGTDGTGGTRGGGWPNGSHGSDGTLAGVGGGSGDGHVGASGPFGGGGGGSRAVGSAASNASGYGAGGGGGAGGGAPGTPSSNGGNGSPGLVIIEY